MNKKLATNIKKLMMIASPGGFLKRVSQPSSSNKREWYDRKGKEREGAPFSFLVIISCFCHGMENGHKAVVRFGKGLTVAKGVFTGHHAIFEDDGHGHNLGVKLA